jgi:hypothetical protein
VYYPSNLTLQTLRIRSKSIQRMLRRQKQTHSRSEKMPRTQASLGKIIWSVMTQILS